MDINEVLNMNIFKVWSKFVVASMVGIVLNTIYTRQIYGILYINYHVRS